MKCAGVSGMKAVLNVAPFAGAWIEINGYAPQSPTRDVAPFAGAWIEIRGVKK